MSLKTRLQRLEQIGVPAPQDTGPTLQERMEQFAQQYQAADAKRRAEVAAALSSGEREAWARAEAGQITAFDALPESEQMRLALAQYLQDFRDDRLDQRRFPWERL